MSLFKIACATMFGAGIAIGSTAAFAQDAMVPDPTAPAADAAPADAAAPAAKKPVVKKVKKKAAVADTGSVWAGKAMQVGRGGGYNVTVTLTAKGGSTDYPDLGCGGTLAKVGAKGDDSFFVETITKGTFDPASSKGCIGGTVTLVKAGDSMIYGWIGTFNNKPVVAYATLAKQAPLQQ